MYIQFQKGIKITHNINETFNTYSNLCISLLEKIISKNELLLNPLMDKVSDLLINIHQNKIQTKELIKNYETNADIIELIQLGLTDIGLQIKDINMKIDSFKLIF